MADLFVLSGATSTLYVFPSQVHPQGPEPEPETPTSHRSQSDRLRAAHLADLRADAIHLHHRRREEAALVVLGAI